jgi:eukaryotic-like serine/threonine-protein kinase
VEGAAQLPHGSSDATSNYRSLCVLATGGMGRVDLAMRQEGAFRRLYAVKRLKESYREEEDFLRMFLDEARIAGFLRHPNVVSVLDLGRDADGPYLVMDYVEGVSLNSLIARVRSSPIPTQVALSIAQQIAEGLHAAHELTSPEGDSLHLVHRDVSPQNVLVGYDGVARITDFGIAKAMGRVW